MPAWLTKFGPALLTLLKSALSSLGYFAAYVSGRRKQRDKDQRETLEALRKGAAAGAAVKHDDISVRDDPLNRD